MKTKVACVSCGEFFEPDHAEILEFIKNEADLKYLRRIPFPSQYRDQYKTRQHYLAFLMLGYCPYCRSVKFGKAQGQGVPNNGISDAEFIKGFMRDVETHGGFQFFDTSEDYVALVNDEKDN